MSASTQYTNLYNGEGFVYVTGPSGTFPATTDEKAKWPYPDTGFYNFPQATGQVMWWALRNEPDNGAGYATFIITVTSAAADNCTSVLVNGVAQTAGAIAMTVGDTTASATSIAAGINSFVPGAGPNYRAFSVGNMIIGTSDTTGSGNNGDTVTIAFSGASTATTTDVGAGRAVGEDPVRIWLDVSNSASETVMGPNAVEITDWVTHRGTESPRIKQDVNVVASTLSFERMGNEMTIEAQLNGTVTNIVSIGALDRDRITVTGNGVHTQTLTASATIGLNGSAVLTTALTNVTFEWDAPNTKWNEVSRSLVVDPTLLRANGVAVPLQEGVFQLTPTNGTATITPGSTGVSAFPGIVYEHDVVLTAGAVLGAAMNFTVDATGALQGDTGTISGNNQAVTGDVITFSDNTGIRATLSTRMAATGRWTVVWTVNDVGGAATVSFSVVPDFGTAHTLFLDTAMYADLSVTDGKIATGVSGAKLTAGSTPITALDAATQARILRLAPRTITNSLALNNAVDGDLLNISAIVNPTDVVLDITLGTTQVITVTKVDTGTIPITIQDNNAAIKIDTEDFWTLTDQWDSVTLYGNGSYWTVLATYPYKPLSCTIDINAVTTLDLTAANRRVAVVNVTSPNPAETIEFITNGPVDHDLEIRPETGLVLTLDGTAIAGNVADSIALQAATLVLDGDLFEVARVRWNGNLWVFQDSNQGIV